MCLRPYLFFLSTCAHIFDNSVMFKKKRTYARWRVNDAETLHVTTAAISFFKTANLIIKTLNSLFYLQIEPRECQ